MHNFVMTASYKHKAGLSFAAQLLGIIGLLLFGIRQIF